MFVNKLNIKTKELYEECPISFLKETFEDANINCEGIVTDKNRKTIVKTRISGSCSQSVTQQIVRIDRETTSPLSVDIENKIIKNM